MYKFLQFDIRDFYSSIKETLLHEAIQFAREHVAITRKDVEVIFHAQKSLLHNDGEPWVKKEGGSFDVTMGAYDGSEVCELIGIYVLYLIGKMYDSKNIGLYRDDGLAAFKNVSEPASEKIKKQLQSLFKQKGLQIVIECHLKVVNYLGVTFNLNDGSYRPYREPNDETHYIHIQSDHPPSITKQLSRSIEKRLSQLLPPKDIFYETTPYYEQRLASCGYNEKLTYQEARRKY